MRHSACARGLFSLARSLPSYCRLKLQQRLKRPQSARGLAASTCIGQQAAANVRW